MEPDYSDITVKNPRIGKVMRLEEEAKRQSEIEKLRSRRIRQMQILQRNIRWKENLRRETLRRETLRKKVPWRKIR
jgi:hypothetical protein